MKILRRLIILALFFFVDHSLRAQVASADTLVQKVFATLKAKDQNAFVALYPNGQQFGRFIRKIMEKALKSDEMKKMMAADEKSRNMNLDSLIDAQVAATTSAEAFGKMQASFGKSFQQIIEKGEQKGVKWSEAKLTTYTLDSASVGDKEGVPFQLPGLKEAKGVIDFTVGDSAYQLAYEKMMSIESEGGWFGGEFTQLARKGESLEPDKSSTPLDDSAATRVDTTTTEPANKKLKIKTPTSKVKVKPATPARKPKTKY